MNKTLTQTSTLKQEKRTYDKIKRINELVALTDARVDLTNLTSEVYDDVKLSAKVGEGFIKAKVRAMKEISDICMNTNGKILNYLLENMRYGNLAYVSPTSISKDMSISLSSVCRSLKALEDHGLIVENKAKNGGKFYLISPHAYVKGDTKHESIAKAMWEKQLSKKTKEIINQSSNVYKLK